MKKVVISVVATLLVLVCLAQTGLLEIFGIHGISFYTKKKEKDSSAGGAESYTDNQTGISYRFKAEGDYFYIYESGDWKQMFMRGVNIGATEPGLFPGDLTISYDTYYRWFGYISEMNCNCIRIYTLMPPQYYESGLLKYGNANPESGNYDSQADFYFKNGKLEVRIAWYLLNVANARLGICIGELNKDEIGFTEFSDIYVGSGSSGEIKMFSAAFRPLGNITVKTRLKKSYKAMQGVFAEIS